MISFLYKSFFALTKDRICYERERIENNRNLKKRFRSLKKRKFEKTVFRKWKWLTRRSNFRQTCFWRFLYKCMTMSLYGTGIAILTNATAPIPFHFLWPITSVFIHPKWAWKLKYFVLRFKTRVKKYSIVHKLSWTSWKLII